MQLTLGESKRPQQIIVYKSVSETDAFVPWLHMVTEQHECIREFRVPVKTVPDADDAVLCLSYPHAAAEINEEVNRRSLSLSSLRQLYI